MIYNHYHTSIFNKLSNLCFQVVAFVLAVISNTLSMPAPDSADIIPLPPGLAYGKNTGVLNIA